MAGIEGPHIATQSVWLVDRKNDFRYPTHRCSLKTIINRFLNARTFSRFESFSIKHKKRHPRWMSFFMAGIEGLEPPECRNQNPMPYQLGYIPVYILFSQQIVFYNKNYNMSIIKLKNFQFFCFFV